MDDALTIVAAGDADPGGSKLCALLDTRFAYERARTVRRRWLNVLAIICGATWLIGSPLAPGWTSVGAAASAVVLLRAALAGAREWHWQRRWADALAAHPGAGVLGPAGT